MENEEIGTLFELELLKSGRGVVRYVGPKPIPRISLLALHRWAAELLDDYTHECSILSNPFMRLTDQHFELHEEWSLEPLGVIGSLYVEPPKPPTLTVMGVAREIPTMEGQ